MVRVYYRIELRFRSPVSFLASSLLDLVQQGQSIALVSDAGVPTISDPGRIDRSLEWEEQIDISFEWVDGLMFRAFLIPAGQDIVSQACSLSLPVVTIPGPSAVVSALSISGAYDWDCD